MSIEELNSKIAFTKQVIATTENYKCKVNHLKTLRKLLKERDRK